MRPFYLIYSVSAWLLFFTFPHAFAASNEEGACERQPNIVVILADDLGYGDLKCFNPRSKIETKNLDQLAKQGMRFTDAHAPGPLCHLSRYGLLTGQYPFRAKVGQWSRRPVITENQATIATLLKSSGYATAMVGKWHLGFDERGYYQPMTGGPVDRGFDSFFGIRASTDIPPYFYIRGRRAIAAPTVAIEANKTAGWSPIQGEFWRKGKIAPGMQLKDVLPRFTDEAIGEINNHVQNKSDKPMFLYLAFPAPHTPWLPDEKFRERSGAGMYGDFVMMVDDMIGKVLGHLKSVGMDENTIVIFTSDNGPVWYEKDVQKFGHDSSGGIRGMKADAWEAGHRMPFIVKWPGMVKPNSKSKQLICFTDLMATFAHLLNVELPEDAGPDSVSFLPALKGAKDATSMRKQLVMASGNRMMTIRSGNWKLIDGLGSGGFSRPGRIKPKEGEIDGQLYNLDTDLAEQNNLFSENPEIVSRLRQDLEDAQRRPSSQLANDLSPHIVLVMADDQGWGQTSYNGHPILRTPNLDAMAANGLRFERFYAGAPVCSPTRASVLTGRTNRRAGVELYGYALRRQEKTIAQLLKQKGYATGHFGKWHLNGLKGPGIPIFADDSHHPGVFGFDYWLSVSNYFDRDPLLARMGQIEEFKGDSSEIVMDEAVRFIKRQVEKNKPSFSVVWFGTPHGPFRASDKDAAVFANLDNKSRHHHGELVAMDRSIGFLRKSLRDMGIAKETLVWFTSDNGGLPNIKPDTVGGLRGNKGSLYEGGIRVPAVIEWPQLISPRSTHFPSVTMDIAPTLAEVTGIDDGTLMQPSDGISLVKLMKNEVKVRTKKIPFAFRDNLAVIDNDYKLIRKTNTKTGKITSELYDLSNDRVESNNLYDSKTKVAKRLDNWVDDFKTSLVRSIDGKDYPEERVLPGEPVPTRWNTIEKFKPYFKEWKKRPEYKSMLKSAGNR